MIESSRRSEWKRGVFAILAGGLIAGVLDLTQACVLLGWDTACNIGGTLGAQCSPGRALGLYSGNPFPRQGIPIQTNRCLRSMIRQFANGCECQSEALKYAFNSLTNMAPQPSA